jgi:FG-GAP repeat protein
LNAGAAWVFARSGALWVEQGGKLTAGDNSAFGEFGYSVALSADGGAALVGSRLDDRGIGTVILSAGSPLAWQGSTLRGRGEAGMAIFGHSVALSGDGATALVGAPLDSGPTGAVWAFRSS